MSDKTATKARKQIHAPTRKISNLCPVCGGSGRKASPFDACALLDAIALYVGPATFNSRDLMVHAKVTGGLLQLAISNMSTIKLGKALYRISMMGDFDGVFLERQGRDKAGVLWRVRFPEKV